MFELLLLPVIVTIRDEDLSAGVVFEVRNDGRAFSKIQK